MKPLLADLIGLPSRCGCVDSWSLRPRSHCERMRCSALGSCPTIGGQADARHGVLFGTIAERSRYEATICLRASFGLLDSVHLPLRQPIGGQRAVLHAQNPDLVSMPLPGSLHLVSAAVFGSSGRSAVARGATRVMSPLLSAGEGPPSNVAHSPDTSFELCPREGDVFIDMDAAGEQVLTHMRTLPRQPLPAEGSPRTLVFEDDKYGAMLGSDEQVVFLEDFLTRMLYESKNGELIITDRDSSGACPPPPHPPTTALGACATSSGNLVSRGSISCTKAVT